MTALQSHAPLVEEPRVQDGAGVRLVVRLSFAAMVAAWVISFGIPADPISMFVWLWLAAVAWRWGVPARRHLDFAADWWPALATLLFYTYTRGFADQLGIEPEVTMPIVVDTWLGGGMLPTQRLQEALCGSTCADPTAGVWYDTIFTTTYVTHFVAGFLLAIVLWLRNRQAWAHWMRRYLALNVAGLVIYVFYPMVPPWMASENGFLATPIERMTGRGGSAPGLQLAQLIMGPIGNPVAAMPSLHAGTACLVAFYAVAVLRTRWRWLALAYPLVMTTALVYFGEHYVIDAVAGAALAVLVMVGCTWWEHRRRGLAAEKVDERPGAHGAGPRAADVGEHLAVVGDDHHDSSLRLGLHELPDDVVGDHAGRTEEHLHPAR